MNYVENASVSIWKKQLKSIEDTFQELGVTSFYFIYFILFNVDSFSFDNEIVVLIN